MDGRTRTNCRVGLLAAKSGHSFLHKFLYLLQEDFALGAHFILRVAGGHAVHAVADTKFVSNVVTVSWIATRTTGRLARTAAVFSAMSTRIAALSYHLFHPWHLHFFGFFRFSGLFQFLSLLLQKNHFLVVCVRGTGFCLERVIIYIQACGTQRV